MKKRKGEKTSNVKEVTVEEGGSQSIPPESTLWTFPAFFIKKEKKKIWRKKTHASYLQVYPPSLHTGLVIESYYSSSSRLFSLRSSQNVFEIKTVEKGERKKKEKGDNSVSLFYHLTLKMLTSWNENLGRGCLVVNNFTNKTNLLFLRLNNSNFYYKYIFITLIKHQYNVYQNIILNYYFNCFW